MKYFCPNCQADESLLTRTPVAGKTVWHCNRCVWDERTASSFQGKVIAMTDDDGDTELPEGVELSEILTKHASKRMLQSEKSNLVPFTWGHKYIGDGVDRAKVFGGWIVRSQEHHGEHQVSIAICFVPDPNHEWRVFDEKG